MLPPQNCWIQLSILKSNQRSDENVVPLCTIFVSINWLYSVKISFIDLKVPSLEQFESVVFLWNDRSAKPSLALFSSERIKEQYL